jgi:CheY-like chemotaxis protein
VEKRILLVEDNADFREAFTRALGRALARERFDVAFVEAGSLAEARARLQEGGLDAALIDVGLPDGDGLDLVREINDGGAGDHIPTLVLTASLDHTVAARAMDAVDTVGAGDAFVAGFLSGRLRGWDVRECLRLANACGACAVTVPGDVEGMPTEEEALSLVRGHRGTER